MYYPVFDPISNSMTNLNEPADDEECPKIEIE